MQGRDAPQIAFKKRERAFPLPEAPMRVYEAPELRGDTKLNLMDWGPQSNPFVTDSKLAVVLGDQVYLMDHQTGKN